MNLPITLSAGPLNCRLLLSDRLTRKTVQERYADFLSNAISENLLEIFPSAKLIPKEEEFNLNLRVTQERVSFFSSSTDGYFDTGSGKGLVNIAANRLDNPATLENALRHLFGILALSRGYVFVHGAACFRGDSAWVFLGPSGSGKSTVASFARRGGYGILSDDFILLGGTKTLCAFSSPFFGQVRAGSAGAPGAKHKTPFRVRGIYLLHKADRDCLIPIDSTPERVAHILGNVPVAQMCDRGILNRILDILDRIGKETPLYQMHFTNSAKFLDFLETR